MTKSKNTKRSLLASIFSMIMCLAMLIGATFAWFSDSVVSGNNQIIAGNLDVELWHQNGIVNEKVEPDTELFKNKDGTAIKWEPGVMVYENFTVKNIGSLALKYQLTVNAGNPGTYNEVDVNGTKKSLKNVLKVAFINKHLENVTREQVLNDETIKLVPMTGFVAGFTKTDSLNVDDLDKKYCMIFYWEPTENDDDYNLKDGKKTTDEKDELYINLGVRLVATQDTVENDSFGNDYDKGLEATTTDGLIETTDDGSKLNHTENGEVVLKSTQGVQINDGIYNVPEGVTTIGSYAFKNNKKIQTIRLSPTVRTLKNSSFTGTSASHVELNKGLTTIGGFAFLKATNLKTITIPSTVTTIGTQAFAESGITSLTIPESVTKIEGEAFKAMPYLTTLTIKGNPSIGTWVAYKCPNLTHVYLKGDNVTFTTPGRTFTNGGTDGSDASKITIHVKNDTVKDRVITAQGKATGYSIEVEGQQSGGD